VKGDRLIFVLEVAYNITKIDYPIPGHVFLDMDVKRLYF